VVLALIPRLIALTVVAVQDLFDLQHPPRLMVSMRTPYKVGPQLRCMV